MASSVPAAGPVGKVDGGGGKPEAGGRLDVTSRTDGGGRVDVGRVEGRMEGVDEEEPQRKKTTSFKITNVFPSRCGIETSSNLHFNFTKAIKDIIFGVGFSFIVNVV